MFWYHSAEHLMVYSSWWCFYNSPNTPTRLDVVFRSVYLWFSCPLMQKLSICPNPVKHIWVHSRTPHSIFIAVITVSAANIVFPVGQRCWGLHVDPHIWSLLWSLHLMDALSAKPEPEQSSAGLRLPLRCLCYDWWAWFNTDFFFYFHNTSHCSRGTLDLLHF